MSIVSGHIGPGKKHAGPLDHLKIFFYSGSLSVLLTHLLILTRGHTVD